MKNIRCALFYPINALVLIPACGNKLVLCSTCVNSLALKRQFFEYDFGVRNIEYSTTWIWENKLNS